MAITNSHILIQNSVQQLQWHIAEVCSNAQTYKSISIRLTKHEIYKHLTIQDPEAGGFLPLPLLGPLLLALVQMPLFLLYLAVCRASRGEVGAGTVRHCRPLSDAGCTSLLNQLSYIY